MENKHTTMNDPETPRETRTFGENLRDARNHAGLSQQALALSSGMDRATISIYENGGRQPRLDTILKLARALEHPPATLLRDLR
jgi:transcriptional regulator with XRE-family HTH domain